MVAEQLISIEAQLSEPKQYYFIEDDGHLIYEITEDFDILVGFTTKDLAEIATDRDLKELKEDGGLEIVSLTEDELIDEFLCDFDYILIADCHPLPTNMDDYVRVINLGKVIDAQCDKDLGII